MQTQLVLEAMESFKSRVLKQLEALTAVSEKMDKIDEISARLDGLDLKFAEQVDHLDVVQGNVNLALKSIGKVRQEQVMAAQEFKSKQSPHVSSSAEEGILGSPPPPPQYYCTPPTPLRPMGALEVR